MAARLKASNLGGGAHTAGIYADLSVDGPVIGTLVIIVDRAKNLPNRKTIGKQDPYCAARLGKEAKKTATDIRGGQTPRWDQELRFTVHDSSDYYQLKISIFTDDKKTDLVGESWIDLKAIIVDGGGQKDLWQTLTCRGKYAGEIRLEITFYDTRAKPDKPVLRAKQPTVTEEDAATNRQRVPKRRPLPSDPVTGEAPPQPASAPPAIADISEHFQTPPRGHGSHTAHAGSIPHHSPLQAMEHSASLPQTIPRHLSSDQNVIASQITNNAQYSSRPTVESRGPREPYNSSTRRYNEHERSARGSGPQYDQADFRRQQEALQENNESWTRQEDNGLISPSAGRPPPPPVHRSNHGSPSQEISPRHSFENSLQKPSPIRQDVLRSEAHRSSLPSYPGRPNFRNYDSAPTAIAKQPSFLEDFENDHATPRHQSYDTSQSQHQSRSMQPTVEDAPETPYGYASDSYGQGSSRHSYHEDSPSYAREPSPEPLRASRSYGESPRYREPTTSRSPGHYNDGFAPHHSSPSPSGREVSQDISQGSVTKYSYSSSYGQTHYEPERSMARDVQPYDVPPIPSSLIPALDPRLSQDINNQISEERLREASGRYPAMNTATPARGYDRNDSQQSYPTSPGGSAPNYSPQRHDHYSGVSFSNDISPMTSHHGNALVNTRSEPQHGIRRKSVSPAPLTREDRTLSDVPFGPDSYNSLNPSAVRDAPHGVNYGDRDAKIIDHDGREIDPTDHLPMSSWAPEPEPKVSREASSEPRSRQVPSGAQPMPQSGRRPLRVAGRHSMSVMPTASHYQPDHQQPPSTVASQGRQRLQKKDRRSAVLTQSDSRPLAPISGDNIQDRHNFYSQSRGNPRAGAWDYPSENSMQQYNGSVPPIPAKIPLHMSGANGGADQDFMNEMSRIDIGAGRSRRRGGY